MGGRSSGGCKKIAKLAKLEASGEEDDRWREKLKEIKARKRVVAL